MVSNKSLDEIKLIAALLLDVQTSHGVVFNKRVLKLTLNKVISRTRHEGLGFLTKTLPRLGKAFDKALSGNTPLSAIKLGFEPLPNSELPRFLGEFFSRVLHPDGTVLRCPCAESVSVLRQVLYLMYKYELPYTASQEQGVLDKFVKTEQDLHEHSGILQAIACSLPNLYTTRRNRSKAIKSSVDVAREAKILLSRVFSSFDPQDIVPRHGPGAVSTKERLWDKYRWSNISSRIASVYPIDAFYYTSLGHVNDRQQELFALTSNESNAKVILVPKDSRGPRLISEEPVDFQWIQQGLSKAIVHHVEHIELTRHNVFFTDQEPNRRAAFLGSLYPNGRISALSDTKRQLGYATLDLNEASDRVSLDLVRLLFPSDIIVYLEACRSQATTLPTGVSLKLKKFAPMGSALCFPILALTTWAILTAAAPDRDTRESILVYGDDVVVPRTFVPDAIKHLESFGLKVNRDKSCYNGLFRESCGMDAFNGVNVTPVRLRTLWSTSPSPESYTSWISYANSFYDKKYHNVYDYIVERLSLVYGDIPDDDMHLACPSLRVVPDSLRPKRIRTNVALQKRQWKVWDVKSVPIRHVMDGWSMLLRYHTEGSRTLPSYSCTSKNFEGQIMPFSVSLYTKRRASMLVRRWR